MNEVINLALEDAELRKGVRKKTQVYHTLLPEGVICHKRLCNEITASTCKRFSCFLDDDILW